MSVPKSIRAVCGAKITSLWKYHSTKTMFSSFDTTSVPRFDVMTTIGSRSTDEQSAEEEMLRISQTNFPSGDKNISYRVHPEQTYKETFVEVPLLGFTDILRNVCTRSQIMIFIYKGLLACTHKL